MASCSAETSAPSRGFVGWACCLLLHSHFSLVASFCPRLCFFNLRVLTHAVCPKLSVLMALQALLLQPVKLTETVRSHEI